MDQPRGAHANCRHCPAKNLGKGNAAFNVFFNLRCRLMWLAMFAGLSGCKLVLVVALSSVCGVLFLLRSLPSQTLSLSRSEGLGSLPSHKDALYTLHMTLTAFVRKSLPVRFNIFHAFKVVCSLSLLKLLAFFVVALLLLLLLAAEDDDDAQAGWDFKNV